MVSVGGDSVARRMCVAAIAVALLLLTPTCCSGAGASKDGAHGALSLWPETRILFEEGLELEKRSSSWGDLQSGDDAVPSASWTPTDDDTDTKYRNWVRLQEDMVTQDYGDTAAAANPSNPVPCC